MQLANAHPTIHCIHLLTQNVSCDIMVLCLNWRLGVAKRTHTNPNLAAEELPHKCVQYHHPLHATCEA